MRPNTFSGARSLSSGMSSVSMPELPNLPGVRRNLALTNPKLYREFKASQSMENLDIPEEVQEDDNSLTSYFENSSRLLELSQSISAFPTQGRSYNDLNGRYSLTSQKRDRMSKSRSLPYSSTNSLPSFVLNNSRVCTFEAYFDEYDRNGLVEMSRKVVIKYFLEDNSIEIVEPKIENSGAPHGKFLKRHQIFKPLKPGEEHLLDYQRPIYMLEDFYAGSRLEIYNRTYVIANCDISTKRFLEDIGRNFGGSLPLPGSVYDPKSRAGMSRTSTRTGKSRASARAGFFDYDRKVLRFYGVWDCRSMLFGDEIRIKLHYSLADNTIEIVPMHNRNSGRDRLPKLLKKSQITRKPPLNSTSYEEDSFTFNLPEHSQFEASDTLGSMVDSGEKLQPSRPYHWSDLKIGDLISVASLNVLLTDADEFTREFYNSKNMPLQEPIVAPPPVYPSVHNEIPPYNGFGSEEDSLQTCKHSLIPGPPLKDGLKLKTYQGMILRYLATFANPKEADRTRSFVIQVHLEDDTFQIREPMNRNSGHKGGVFLARCKLETHDGSKPLEPQDLYVGAKVSILSHSFIIHDCDKYTFKYMEENMDSWRFSSLNYVLEKIKDKKSVIQRIMLTYPALASRSIDVDELMVVMERAGLKLVKQEVCTLFRAVDTHRVGVIKMTKMLKFFMDM